VKEIPLYGPRGTLDTRTAKVDDEDYDLVSRHRWFIWEGPHPGRKGNGPYAAAIIVRDDGSRVLIFMHDLIMGLCDSSGRGGRPVGE